MYKNNFIKVTMGTSSNIQFKMMLPPELVERLDNLARKTGKASGQQVVMELIEIYLPTWISVNESLGRSLEHQIKIVKEEKLKSEKKIKGVPAGSLDLTKTAKAKKKTG